MSELALVQPVPGYSIRELIKRHEKLDAGQKVREGARA